jgi:hypothetical protein
MSKMHLDLKAIREKNKMSVQDIYERTRLTDEMIRLIETGEIYSRPDANKTYMRSFTRTYARAIGISDEDIATALDYQDADMYEGFLAEKYLGAGPGSEKKTASGKPDKSKPAEESSVADKIRKPGGFRSGISGGFGKEMDQEKEKKSGAETHAESESRKKAGTENIPASGPDSEDDYGTGDEFEHEDDPGTTATGTASIFSPTIPESATYPATGKPADGDINWADVNRKIVPGSRRNGVLVVVGIIGIILITVLIYLVAGTNEPDADLAVAPGPRLDQLPSDTLGAPLSPDTEQLAAALPDTLRLTVYAARGNLEPVRILSDLYNLQRPFWIEAGHAMQFEFMQEIQIRGNLERMILMYEDRVITDFQAIDTENRVIRISREQFLRDPTMRSFSSEDMPDDLPRPVGIQVSPRL